MLLLRRSLQRTSLQRCIGWRMSSNDASQGQSATAKTSVSSSTPPSSPSTTLELSDLEREKLERIVKLYHGSSTFVTEENLNSYIDERFSPKGDITRVLPRMDNIKNVLETYRSASSTLNRFNLYASTRSTWEDTYVVSEALDKETVLPRNLGAKRMRAVVDSLYGTSSNGQAGVDTVLQQKQQEQPKGDDC